MSGRSAVEVSAGRAMTPAEVEEAQIIKANIATWRVAAQKRRERIEIRDKGGKRFNGVGAALAQAVAR